MSGDKKIVITPQISDAAFDKVIGKVRQLTSEISKLVEVSSKFNLGGGGGGNGSRMTSNTPASGAGGSVSQIAHRMQSAGGGVVDNLSKAVTNSATLFKTAAEGSKGAFRIMSDALKEHVNTSDREVRKLTSSLQSLEKQYDRIKRSSVGATPAGQAAMGSIQQQYYSGAQQLNSAQASHQGFMNAQSQLTAQGTPMGRFGAFMNSPLPGFGPKGGVTQALNGLGLGFLGGTAGLVGAGLMGFNFVNGAMRQNDMSNLGYALDSPFFGSEKKATYGRIFGGNALALRHGDIARAHAMRTMVNDEDFKKIAGDKYKDYQRQQAEKLTPTGLVENIAASGLGGIGTYVKGKVGQGANNASDKFFQGVNFDLELRNKLGRLSNKYLGTSFANDAGGFVNAHPYGTDTPQENERKKRMAFLQTAQPEAYQRYLDNTMQNDPMYNDMVNRVYGGAIGSMSLARAARVGGGTVKDKYGNIKGNSLYNFQARALNAGYDPGEMAGMIGQIGSQGWGFGTRGAESLLSMSHGGLSNAVSLFGTGAQFNGGTFGGGMGFLKELQGKVGRGGLDVTAGASLFGVGAGMMGAGNFADSGGGAFMGALADAAATGNPGTDMLGARMVGKGLGGMQQMLGGAIDPLQQGLNASAALQAAPGGNYGIHKGLMDMDPATMMQVLKTGKVPAWMKARGISEDMVNTYASTLNSTALARYSGSMGEGSDMGAAAARYNKAGGLSYLRGMSNKDKRAELFNLAEVIKDTTGVDRETARGRLLLQASGNGLLDDVKGKGAHQSASMKSIFGASAADQAKAMKGEGDRAAALEFEVKADIATRETAQNSSETARRVSQKQAGGADVDQAIDNVDAALRSLVVSLRSLAGGNRSGLAPVKAGPPRNSSSG